ncbi:MAG TPA: hypothetical protein VFM45_04680 [Anaeromyxobacteraceae bacterium]|nr:hypothetical protein [Anaeromyxobacteraceae bacterium]
MASRLVIHRRRDGLIQLRRRRIWNVLSAPEATAILGLFAACLGISVALIIVLLEPPIVLGVLPLLPVAVIGVWAARAVQPAFASAPLDRPRPPSPPRNAA